MSLNEVLALVALAIMIAPTLAGWVRLPALIGFVLAGALLGPYVLGWLPEGAVDGLGQIGLLYLMFQAGLEVDMAMFRKNRNSALVLGLLGFMLPFVAGILEGRLIFGFSLAAAALIGSIFASHTLVTLPDVREAGLSSSRAVNVTVGATILTDTLALIVLAVATAEGGSPVGVISKVAIGLVALALYGFVVLPWVGKRFFRGTGQTRALRFAFMLFAFSSAGVLAELFGIEGLVGAFLAGLGVNQLAPKDGPLMERIDFFGAALFVPAFLVYVGTKLNPAVLIQPATIWMALLFLLVLLGGKGLAAFLTGRFLKFSLAESGLMFGMTIPQAAATLAATLVGAQVGLFSDQVVNAVVMIVLISIVLGSLLTRRFAAKVELPAGVTRPIGAAVLVGLPAEVDVGPVMKVASSIGAEADGLVMPVAVTTKGDRGTADAERIAKEATKAAEAQGADVEARVRYADSYSSAMLEAIVDRKATALVAPFSTDTGIVSRVFGGELDRIGRESPVPVLAVRVGPELLTKVILRLDPKADARADRYDEQLADEVARALSAHLKLPLAVFAPKQERVAALGQLPEHAETIIGRGTVMDDPGLLVPGSVLVVPASLVRHLGAFANDFARAHPEITVVIAAGPYRLRTSFGAQTATLTGALAGPPVADVADAEAPGGPT